MGREIRKVKPDWEHPKKEEYNYRLQKYEERHHPLYDGSYEEAAKSWLDDLALWLKSEHEAQLDPDASGKDYEPTITRFTQYNGGFPDIEYYRPAWTEEEMTAFQIYETVSEGTPVSPVFTSKEDMKNWLIEQGFSEKAAVNFCEGGWAPSFSFSPEEGIKENIEILG
jgi:hypothetical protein